MSDRTAKFCILETAILWSTMGVIYKFIDCPPLVIGALRGIITYVCYSIYLRNFKIKFSKETICGALLSFSTSTLFTVANKFTTAGNAIVLQYTSPLFVVFITWFFLKKRPHKTDLIMTMVVMVGVFLFFADDLNGGHMVGNICALLSGLFFAAGTVYANKVPPVTYYNLSALASVVIGLPSVVQCINEINTISICGIITLGLVPGFLAGIIYTKGIKHVDPLKASIILMLDPILNPIWVALVVGEIPGVLSLIGSVIVLGGIAFWFINDAKK